jgi:hypothetical protein
MMSFALSFTPDGAPTRGLCELSADNGATYSLDLALDDAAQRELFASVAAARCMVDKRDVIAELERLLETTRAAQPVDQQHRESVASRLVALAQDGTAELWHAGETGFASLRNGDHLEHVPVRGRGFRHWLARRYFMHTRRAAGDQALRDAVATIEGIALFDGQEYKTAVRVADYDGATFIDLCDAQWRAVKVTAAGWEMVTRPPVRFIRSAGMLPLPAPERGGTVQELRRFVNVASDEDWALLLGFLVCAMRPNGPYPILVLTGEQGSAKSTACRLVRALVDPNEAPLRAEPRDKRDLAIMANNSWLVAMDNVSSLPHWLSDALCRLSTGGAFSTRALWTDDEERLFSAQRPVLLNGISDFVTHGDLADRAIGIALPRIDEAARRTERELWAEFDAARPRLFGALLDAVSCALRRLPETRLPWLPRMADAVMWATAAEPALGLHDGAFLAAYDGARESAAEAVLEASLVAPYLAALAAAGGWMGTASALLSRLEELAGDAARRPGWPKRPNSLSAELRRLAPELRRAGVAVDFARAGGRSRTRLVIIEGAKPASTTQSTRTRNGADDADDADDRFANFPHADLAAPAPAAPPDDPLCPQCGFPLPGRPADDKGRCQQCANGCPPCRPVENQKWFQM